jgi:hypothetical protein
VSLIAALCAAGADWAIPRILFEFIAVAAIRGWRLASAADAAVHKTNSL